MLFCNDRIRVVIAWLVFSFLPSLFTLFSVSHHEPVSHHQQQNLTTQVPLIENFHEVAVVFYQYPKCKYTSGSFQCMGSPEEKANVIPVFVRMTDCTIQPLCIAPRVTNCTHSWKSVHSTLTKIIPKKSINLTLQSHSLNSHILSNTSFKNIRKVKSHIKWLPLHSNFKNQININLFPELCFNYVQW